jgi:(p)ppGpp synthase/HD superfamily hydrolase
MAVTTLTPPAVRPLSKTRAALDYASTVHKGQVRDSDGAPFVEHPTEVAQLLYSVGAPDHLVAAGALHDVLEKTPATAFDLRRRFGTEVASLVLAVTEDRGIERYAKRKAALRDQAAAAGHEALMLFAADKVSKARELHRKPRTLRARIDRRRKLAQHRRSLAMLSQRLTQSQLVERLAAELASLSRHAPGPTPLRSHSSAGGLAT